MQASCRWASSGGCHAVRPLLCLRRRAAAGGSGRPRAFAVFVVFSFMVWCAGCELAVSCVPC